MKRILSFYDQVLALNGPTSVDLKKYTRAELLEIILMQAREIDSLRKQVKELKEQMDDKRVVLAEAGSIAEASLALTSIFEEAEKAVAIYKENVKRLSDNQFAYMNQVTEEVTRQAEGILAEADLQGELSRLRSDAMSASEPLGSSNLSNLPNPLEQKSSQQPQNESSLLGQYQQGEQLTRSVQQSVQQSAQQSVLQDTQQSAYNTESLYAALHAYQAQQDQQTQQRAYAMQAEDTSVRGAYATQASASAPVAASAALTQPLAAAQAATHAASAPVAASAALTQPLAAAQPFASAALTQPLAAAQPLPTTTTTTSTKGRL